MKRSLQRFVGIIFLITAVLLPAGIISADEIGKIPLDFYYDVSCPHCHAEHDFLDTIDSKYPISINRYNVADPENIKVLKDKLIEAKATQYFGSVPITFVGNELFLGFDNPDGMGERIIKSIEKQAKSGTFIEENETEVHNLNLPFIGSLDANSYSLPALAVILGFLDGFNVCSLGALALILALVIAMRDRKKIAIFGGAFLITTAVIYGILIVLWAKLFSFLSLYILPIQILIGIIGTIGGIYFLREFMRMKKFGVTCDSNSFPIIGKLTQKVEALLTSKSGIFSIIGGIVLFSGALTIIEFPCSAAVPLFFASLLTEAGLSSLAHFSYISLFILFYLLDEIILFCIAVYKMKTWMTSPKFVIWAVLAEGIILIFFGIYYLLYAII